MRQRDHHPSVKPDIIENDSHSSDRQPLNEAEKLYSNLGCTHEVVYAMKDNRRQSETTERWCQIQGQ